MENETLQSILNKTSENTEELERANGSLESIQGHVSSMSDSLDSVAEELKKLPEKIEVKTGEETNKLLREISTELKKKEEYEEEVSVEIDPEEIRGPQGERGPEGPAGRDGKDGRSIADLDYDFLARQVVERIEFPSLESLTGQDIKIKLESLVGDDRLDASAIKNLPRGRGAKMLIGGPPGQVGSTSTATGTLTGIGTLDSISPKVANGAQISGANIILQTADASFPGLVSTGAQTFAGVKTFASAPILTGFTAGSVLFAGTGGAISQDNAGFNWDDTNNLLRLTSTTEQIRIRYDASNYYSTTVSSTGRVTWNAVGSSPGFTISDPIYDDLTLVSSTNSITTTLGGETLGNMRGQSYSNLGQSGGWGGAFIWRVGVNGGTSRLGAALISGAGAATLNSTLFIGVDGSLAESVRTVGSPTGGFVPLITEHSATAGDRYSFVGSLKQALNGTTEKNLIALSAFTTSTIRGAFFGTQWRPVSGGWSSDYLVETTNEDASQTEKFRVKGTSGNFGINTGATVSAKLHVIETTEQLRVGYDTSNYFSTTVGSTGAVTLNAIGSGARFMFSDGITLPAGTATAGTSPIKFTSGTNLTTAEAGAVEFTTDDLFFTITTGAARKNITLWDTLGTSGRVPFATTNGRLTDDADFTFATDTLTATKMVGTTSIKVGTAAGYISSDGSTGATGTFTTVDGKTVTVKDGIITAIV